MARWIGGSGLVPAATEGKARPGGQPKPRPAEGEAARGNPRVFVGPGFEIVVRAGEGPEFDMTVDTSRKRSQEPRQPQARGQDPDLERRVELVETSLMDLVDQMEEMERKVDEVLREARASRRSR